ncbi:MAG: aminotransferase class I/II-fold pyridoxal phosphate-dependent enzyme [Paramuribaculum sp.]|nr:aminotransferase class I/II-fold pyridoxal phosphate-dependent enzyme [Paramuribaculum sp.]MDE6460655.1 aminotransferase class I/II-fold pyridoxal phosphate-dependent enzyme [Paramuribaculum sp.]
MKSEIKPADRVSSVKEYYFSRKLREVAEMNAKGMDIISLGIGGPDRMPAAEVISTLAHESAKESNHSYQPYVGLPALRQAFADWYKNWYGVELNPDTEIQPLIGSKEGILHISLAFLNPGDGVLVPNPGYPTYTSVSNLVQAEIFTYDLTEENGWKPDFEKLETLPLEKIKLMWVNYPHMPTGTPADMSLYTQLIEFGKKHNIVIAHDNPYSFILNPNPESILSVPGAKDIAIELNSLSKSHNMAGWRVAMLASNAQFVNWILKVKSNIDSGMFKPIMLAAVKALQCDKDWYDELNSVYSERRKIAEEIATSLGCTFDSKQKGLFLWAKVPDDYPSGEKLADDALYKARVFITPGFIFGSNGDRYIRISLCANRDNMLRALNRLKEANLTK